MNPSDMANIRFNNYQHLRMGKNKVYEPLELIERMNDRLNEKDADGKRHFTVGYLESQHLSRRAQKHFSNLEAVTVMHVYAVLRILLLDEPSIWDRILLVCAFIDLLERCFCHIYSVPATFPRPFAIGMRAAVREKMSALLDYDIWKVLK